MLILTVLPNATKARYAASESMFSARKTCKSQLPINHYSMDALTPNKMVRYSERTLDAAGVRVLAHEKLQYVNF
jgi:hypothetical protein